MSDKHVLLCGGVGGAKLALGLSQLIPDDSLRIIVNTGDDFRHLGLAISPDLDTVMYTLAGEVNTETGWGRAGESWECLENLAALGGPDWFRLGDKDLAVHLLRTEALARGKTLSEITAALCSAFGIAARILPMSNDPVATLLHTSAGPLAFQDYFVRQKAEPAVSRIEFQGAADAGLSPEVKTALSDPELASILIAPSNPWLSIDPLLAVPGMPEALQASAAPVVAVSPIVAGRALKGPTAKIMGELGLEASAVSVARHFRPVIDGFILDEMDAEQQRGVEKLGLSAYCCNTVMQTLEDRVNLAGEALRFAAGCR